MKATYIITPPENPREKARYINRGLLRKRAIAPPIQVDNPARVLSAKAMSALSGNAMD
jgi:hypothetical protein